MAKAVLFSDLNCPFCYALGERVEALGLAGQVSWRGVQHAPHLAQPMVPAGPGLASELRHEVEGIQRLAPEVSIVLPVGKPNTFAAICAVAAAMDVDRAKAHQLELALYREFWRQGTDISDSAVLMKMAHACGLGELRVTPEAQRTASSWQAAWELSGVHAVPALIREDGQRLVGLAKSEDLKRFLAVTIKT
jgi:predicted DsbA family dithiol-disulfide isomerase